MLEKIREGSQGPVAKIILGLVIFSFALAGVGSYINSGSEPKAAEVNGLAINVSELERAYENERARMEAQFGEMFSQIASDPAYLANFKQGILDRLISEQLVNDLANRLSIRTSDEEIKKAIFEMPEFQVDGKFNNDRYLQLLTRAGYTPTRFKEMLREDMTRRAVVSALTDTDFVLEDEVKYFQQLQLQKRDIEYVEVPVELFTDAVEISEADIVSHYEANIEQYETEEKFDIAYIELKLDDVAKGIEVSQEEVSQHYKASQAQYVKAERRRASHILIDNSTDDAQQKAQELLAKIEAGEDFAELATTHSADTFSGQNGGDLDFFGKGVMDPAFEEAAFSLENIGDVSEVVESSFGYHIIKLTDIEEETVRPLAEVEQDIVAQLQQDKARDIFLEKQQLLADTAFEVPTSLQDAAEVTDLTVKQTGLQPVSSTNFPFTEAKLIEAAKEDDVLNAGYNSALVEVTGEHLVVLRVNEYQEARTQSLDEVKAQVEDAVAATKARQLAQDWVEQQTADLAAGQDVSTSLADKSLAFTAEQDVARFGSEVARAIVRKAFEMKKPTDTEISAAWVELNPSSFAIVKVNDVKQAEVADADQATAERLESAITDYNYQALISALRENADIVTYQTAN
ncbi:PpiC-type peptidyl-prolyl cis-trans isomerase [Catenovulum agarivorans DS-2]|uniref:Periplasmic chaperone PpiD n=1 Tax=Catenovulum agarivorans DS-2 TaxID=1328313 RepID=W7QVV1_9ALTE|nr:SurA N-terminal domain-containing protein [Catenovulum agarivorans]EWH11848.1 PpiC-type peptidyl-prolyl cis-trans isomerase [Catenovulum agarivorans DS-2]